MLLCVVHDGDEPRRSPTGEPEMRLVYVPRADAEILDTWHVGGLRGTGSHDVVVDGVYAQRERTFALSDPSTLDGTAGRLPIVCTMAAGFAAQMLGVARSALETLRDITARKTSVDSGVALRDRPNVLFLIARHTTALDAARDHLRRRATELWDATETGPEDRLAAITALWTAAHHSIDVSKATVEDTYAAAGTTAIYSDCPLERAHRDVHAMLRHIVAQPFWIEDAGRVQLGMPPVGPLFAI
jgi:alkylation response protein AidB-like acyl-CoA dehydrogenase